MNVIKIQFRPLRVLLGFIIAVTNSYAQSSTNQPVKISHAEPLYLDLVRDLGARKGEKEFNIGADFKSYGKYNEHGLLAEYEFAPVNRLGLEVETDFSLFSRSGDNAEVPANKLECLRLSAQYSFLVSEKHQATLAVGYTEIIEQSAKFIHSPFFVAAKRLGENFHALVYVSSLIEPGANVNWQLNTSVHYVIPQTRHFIGIEFNKELVDGRFEVTLRPQVKVKLNQNCAVGFVTGLPLMKQGESFSSFLRIIYEL